MTKRKILHIFGRRGDWEVKLEGKRASLSHHTSKSAAFETARSLAKNSPLARVKVHDPDGRLEDEYIWIGPKIFSRLTVGGDDLAPYL